MIVDRNTVCTVETASMDETSSDGNSDHHLEETDAPTIYQQDDLQLEKMKLLGKFSTTALYSVKQHVSSSLEGTDALARNNKVAIKCVRRDLPSPSVQSAMKVLLSEVTMLTRTLPSHPNIVQVLGVSWHFEESTHGFAVVELVPETLSQRLSIWKTRSMAERKGFFSRFQKASYLNAKDQAARIKDIAFELASVMKFLRSRRIAYRILQPDCIGLRHNGRKPVLINFAHARVLPKQKSLQDQVGSRCYWAKEVAQKKAYGLSADVYQFGLLLWELLTLERPYEAASNDVELNEWLADPGRHPSLKKVASDRMKNLLMDCWADDTTKRATWSSIIAWLRAEVEITSRAERTSTHHSS